MPNEKCHRPRCEMRPQCFRPHPNPPTSRLEHACHGSCHGLGFCKSLLSRICHRVTAEIGVEPALKPPFQLSTFSLFVLCPLISVFYFLLSAFLRNLSNFFTLKKLRIVAHRCGPLWALADEKSASPTLRTQTPKTGCIDTTRRVKAAVPEGTE